MDPDKALDALIDVLDNELGGDSDIDPTEPVTHALHSDDEDDVPLVANPRIAVNIEVDPDSPKRKRQRLRSDHCKFCEETCSRESLYAHLRQSVSCRNDYFSYLNVTKLDAVICLLFRCLFCNDGPARLATHLRSSPGCFNSYCTKFGVGTIRDVMSKVSALKREGFKSRQPEKT